MMSLKPFLKFIKENGGSISVDRMDYFCNKDSTIIRNYLEKTGFAIHCEGRLEITEAGEQHLNSEEE
jgi:hypothetical protein